MKKSNKKNQYITGIILTLLIWIASILTTVTAGPVITANANQALKTSSIELRREGPDFVAFSPDGNTLASVDSDWQITLWDVTTGLAPMTLPSQAASQVSGIVFSPDGKTLASVGNNALNLLDVVSGQELRSLPHSNTNSAIAQVAFSPDGKRLAGVSLENDILLWNLTTGLSRSIHPSQGNTVVEVKFSPDGKFLASAYNGQKPTIKLWNVASGQLHAELPVDVGVTHMTFSPDSKFLASVGQGGRITLWSPSSGTVKRILNTEGEITSAVFSPDSKMLASGSGGKSPNVQLWNPATGELAFSHPAEGGAAVTDLFYSLDGAFLASIGDDYRISLRDASTGELQQLLVGQTSLITKAAFNSKQPSLVATSLTAIGKDGLLIAWNLVTGLEQHTFQIPTLLSASLAGSQALLSGNAVSKTSSQLTVSNTTGAAKSASLPVGSTQAVSKANTTTAKKRSAQKWKGVKAITISRDGTEMGAAGEDGTIRVFKKNGSQRWQVSGHHGSAIAGIAFRGKTKEWVSAGRDTETKTWDATGKNVQTFYGPEHSPRAVAVSPDGHFIATAGEETRVFLFDAEAGKLKAIFSGHKDFVNGLAFSPGGQILASAGADGRILLHEVASGKLINTLRGHADEVNAVAFSPDGSLLASASQDSTVILWKVTTGQQLTKLAGHQGSVRSVAFSPDGKKLVSAGEDTKMLVWDPVTFQLKKQLKGPSAAINALVFGPEGNLHVGSENSEVSEFNTDTDTKVETIVVPVTPRVGPQSSRSETLTLAARPNQSVLTSSHLVGKSSIKSAEPSSTTLSAIVNQLLDWVIPAAEAAFPNPNPLPDPNQGPGGAILVVTTPTDPFGKYYAEILRTEGLNEFSVADISAVNAATLAAYDLVILAKMPLTADQVSMLNTWVTNGGNLIAMRPDKQLAGFLGLTDASSTLDNGYLLVNTSVSPGNGIVGETMQYHGTADRYTLSGATDLATLYSNATIATSNPAVTLRSIGSAGGQAAAFTYDLATSIVYTHQGNPAWAIQERDGLSPIRSDDKFFGGAAADPQSDWIDFAKVTIPQADEQQRLLANLILEMNRDKKPLPRFWYFPHDLKAVVIMTGDDHANNGTAGRFDSFIASSPPGCSVQNWECIRGTSYIFPDTPLTDEEAANYNAQGFEVGLHVNTNCADFTPAQLESFYVDQIGTWTTKYSSIPAPVTQRHHCIAWSEWVTGAKVQFDHGIRLDTSYYFWPASWILNRPGFFSGSGMPMRFADVDGSFIDVYQATTQMTDESGQSYPFTINSLLDKALGAEGYYGAFTINAHTDIAQIPESDAVVASALARQVPIITSRQMMNWLDFRNSSSFSAMTWSGNTLSFTVTPADGIANVPVNGLQVLVPLQSAAGVLNGLTLNGSATPYTSTIIKGVEYAAFSSAGGSYVATYSADTTAPTVTSKSPAAGATGVSQAAVITATFSEAINPTTINATTFELRDSSNSSVAASVSYDANTHTAALIPAASLAASATYTVTVRGGVTDPAVKDLAGNALGASEVWTFTTGTQACSSSSCSVWTDTTIPGTPSVNDPGSVELGVKFKSDVGGYITGIRFYNVNTGSYAVTLWSSAGQQLATTTFTAATSGWQQASFPAPVAITANTVYVASYHAPNGNYAADDLYFANKGIGNAPIHLLQDGVSGGNGVFAYSASKTFPTDTYRSTNYWVDVVFTTNAAGPDTMPPIVASTWPITGATGVSLAVQLTATFSEAVDGTTIGSSTFQLRDSSNTLVPATVSYNALTNTATLTPASELTSFTPYSVKVIGGASGVKDLAGNTLAGDYTWSLTTGGDPCLPGGNPIVCENSKTGNPSSEWDISGVGDLSIQGYATDISVNRAQTVRFKIDTPSTDYRLDIYRMGYYAGKGARKVATVQPTATLPQNQPACLTEPVTGLIDCGNWTESASWLVPADAASGIYFAKVIREDGANTGASHIIFIVRDDASTSDVLFQTSDTTWQAYNNYGGNSLYTGAGPGTGGSSDGRAYKVSYNRPFNTRNVDNGQDWVFNAEYPMVRWLEANGYNISYFTGIDSDRLGNLISQHKLFLSVGHDEYWSGTQRTNVENAKDAGVNLAFFSGNEVYWKTRWENNITNSSGVQGTDSYRTLVCYKETHNFSNNPDPLATIWTGTWRDPRALTLNPPKDGGRPENALKGTIFMVNDGATTSITVPDTDGKMRFWRDTSVASLASGNSATLPNGTLGYEWNVDMDNGFRPGGLVRLSTTVVPNAPILTDNGSTFGSGTANHALTLFKAASGALVFGAGTVQWSWGLDSNHDRSGTPTNTAMQQATVNLFADMGIQPSSLQGESGLSVATASTDTTAPNSSVVFPSAGATVASGSTITIAGTAADTGGQVGGIEVSVDGGLTWHPADGRSSWSYVWTVPSATGPVTIRSRAVDDSLNMEVSGTGITVIVDGTPPPPVCSSSPCSAWPNNTVPGTLSANDPGSVELGVKFKSDISGLITGVRFYQVSTGTTFQGTLWSITGQQLATGTVTSTSSGWQQVNFTTPVAITAGTVYVASYHAPNGNYAVNNTFATAGIDNPPIHLLKDGENGGNGVYTYGASTTYPSNTYNSSNYWVDVVFSTNNGSDTTPPMVNSTTPAANASGVSPANPVLVTFSEAMLSATIDATTFELRDSSNALVPASVVYNAQTNTATLTPNSTLAASTLYSVKIKSGAAGVKDAAGNALVTDYNWSFTTGTSIQPCSSSPCSAWSNNTVPGTPSANDPGSVELGVKFKSDISGLITGVRFYQVSTGTTFQGTLWSITGQQLATGTVTSTSSGWQQVNFTTPVAITAGTVYVASYHAPNGNYAVNNTFATAGIDNPPIHLLKDGVNGGNGVYTYGASTTYPSNTYNSSNYWVDVVFSTNNGSDTTPPMVNSTTPAANASGVSPANPVLVTFSEAMLSATIDATTFELRDSSNALVPASVVYNAQTNAATLTPNSTLAASTLYSATIKSGAAGVKDAAGNALVTDYNWSFTTGTSIQPCSSSPCSAWPNNTVPGTPSVNDPGSVELGVKFKSDISGLITGVRFYQVSTGTTFQGTLWSITGQQLATGTVTSTASGWQQVNFTTPVAITAGTVYVASYHAPNGNYAVNSTFATAGVDNPPIHLLKDGENGGNGLYAYSAISTYPSSSFNSSNYWVDVVFSTGM